MYMEPASPSQILVSGRIHMKFVSVFFSGISCKIIPEIEQKYFFKAQIVSLYSSHNATNKLKVNKKNIGHPGYCSRSPNDAYN